MTSRNEMLRMVRRNKLVGLWAAEKLGFVGEGAKAYSDALAMRALDLKRCNVLNKIREDFSAAGVVQSDEQILQVMNQFLLEAASHERTTGANASDVALVQIARNLQSN